MGEAVAPSDTEYDPSVHLEFQDVRLNSTTNPQWLEVRIKASKTDPFCCGVSLYLGKTRKRLCPVAAILAHMVLRGNK